MVAEKSSAWDRRPWESHANDVASAR